MQKNPFAIELRNVSFAYATTVKKPLFSKLNLPINRTQVEIHPALKDVSLNIRRNCITTLLGKNGSGKTTLIKMICGARFPDHGKISVLGKSPNRVLHRLGLFMGNTLIYHRLTGRENLQYFGKLYDVRNLRDRIDYLGGLLRISKQLDQVVEGYSFGMKIKLGLARAMIHSPEILILDEPTLGIDIQLARQLREFIRDLKCTILLTTHYMEEAEQLSDELCLIDSGKVLSYGSKESIFERYEVSSVPDAFTSALGTPVTVPAL